MSQNLLEEYTIFVDKITSESSKSTKKNEGTYRLY